MQLRAVAAIVVAALLVSSCGGDDTDDGRAIADQGADQAGAADTTGVAPAATTPEALRFSAPLVGGGELDGAGLAGRPVLLWFWAPY